MADAPLPGRGLPQASAEVAASQARRTLLASLVVTAVLFVVPGGEIVGYPLLLISTYVHEMGHGLAAILVGVTADGIGLGAAVIIIGVMQIVVSCILPRGMSADTDQALPESVGVGAVGESA